MNDDSQPLPEHDEDEQLRVVLEATPVAIVVGDERGTIVLANTHAQSMFGYRAGEIIGRDSKMLVPERFHAVYEGLRDEYLSAPTGRPMDPGHELYGLRKDGTEVPIEVGLNPVRTRRGAYVLAAIVDISERLLAEERTHTEEQMRLVIDGSADAMLVTDARGSITLVNNRLEMMFGYLRPELLKNSIEMLIPERFREAHRTDQNNQPGKHVVERAFWGLHKDGREVSIEVGLSPLSTSRGEYVLASIVDVSARKRAEEIRLADALHAEEISALNAEKAVVEDSLAGSERQVHRQANRLASLWRIINTPSLHGAELVETMLREAATVIRPGQAYAGMLGHIEGSEYVLDAVAGQEGGDDAGAIEGLFRTGRRADVSETLFARDAGAGRTQSWDDVQSLPDLTARARDAGLRSEIATHFVANDTAYVLCLVSRQPPSVFPFGPPDYEYVEVIASFFARHLEQERLEASLRAAEERARQHAERLAALWQVANNPLLRGQDLLFAMLRQGAAALRSQQRFQGLLGRIEGHEVVVIGIGAEPGTEGPIAEVRIGRRTALDETLVPSTTGTRAWDDISALSSAPPSLAFLGWRAAITTQFSAGGSQYWLIFGSSEPTTTSFDEEDHAYLDVLASSFANQLQVTTLEGSLHDAVERTRRHVERLDALQNIANNPNLQHEELLQAMLGQAAASIRPGQNFRGVLWFIAGSEITIKAVASGRPILDRLSAVGSSVPIAETVVGAAIAGGRGTQSWDHMRTGGHRSALGDQLDTESLIVTTFRAGTTNWGLSFACGEATREPLGAEDYAYVEVLASFFANLLQQQWQFERLEYQQSHDVLTGLLSRSQFRSQARAAAHYCERFAIILVNIDAFREINETRGHMIGDAVLVEVGNALRKRATGNEIVGRIEGDVFGIYVPEPASVNAVQNRALDYAGVFARAFRTGDAAGTDRIARTGSLGIAVAPEDGTLIDTVLLRAGTALANAKARGPGSVVFYEAGMEGDAARRTALLSELAEALAANQFVLYYQPHVEVSSGKVTGCEALIRWNHPKRGLLLPSHFIPFAEANGAIASIDAWVMHSALSAANELAAMRPGFRVFFNLSGRQAGNSKIIREFTTAARNGVELANIGVEITESDAMRDVEATRHVCRALRRLNILIAIDDFGTGYSSLSFLKRLPVDVVKIDRSFISGILSDPHDATIAETIIAITKNFGFDSLAEGVEDFAEADWLRKRACRYMQGFAICRPLPFDAFKVWLAARAL